MAVIRARRLWAAHMTNGLLAERDDEHPEFSAIIAYTCPVGYRAIIRTITSFLSTFTAGEEPIVKYMLAPYPNQEGYWFDWYWFIEHQPSLSVLRQSHLWNGQLVLHGGDQVQAACFGAPQGVDTTASGHLLPELGS